MIWATVCSPSCFLWLHRASPSLDAKNIINSFPGGSDGNGKIPWRRKWQPTPVLLPRRFHGWKNLWGYSPWGRKESDMTEWLPFFHGIKRGRWGSKGEKWLQVFSGCSQSPEEISFLLLSCFNYLIRSFRSIGFPR